MEMQNLEKIKETAERLLQSISASMTVLGQQCQLAATMGIGLYPKDGLAAHELLRTADVAVYRGKRKCRGSFIFYDATLDIRTGI